MKGPLKDSTVWRRFSAVNDDDDGGQVDSIVQLYLNLPKLKVRQVVARWHRAVGGRRLWRPEEQGRRRQNLSNSTDRGVVSHCSPRSRQGSKPSFWSGLTPSLEYLLRCRSSNIYKGSIYYTAQEKMPGIFKHID